MTQSQPYSHLAAGARESDIAYSDDLLDTMSAVGLVDIDASTASWRGKRIICTAEI
jgi:hypothetical protein